MMQLMSHSFSNCMLPQVPGLAENRPSVLRGDALFVRPSDGSSGNKEYEGFVHGVQMENVGAQSM